MIDYVEDGKLNKVLCGGEVLPPILAEKLLDICSELYNVYGPTETTIWSTSKRVLSKNDLSIGTPISNTRIYILDQHLRPVPRGCLGELYITGAGVTQGYNGLDKLTQEKFILNPYSNNESLYEKMYRTGDLVYLNNDCEICFSGRSDNQVKVRGHRIEVKSKSCCKFLSLQSIERLIYLSPYLWLRHLNFQCFYPLATR